MQKLKLPQLEEYHQISIQRMRSISKMKNGNIKYSIDNSIFFSNQFYICFKNVIDKSFRL